ncbi:MAG: hypothetical protein IH901_02570 [Proteobacteria bacterium]|nr:hypothetical protein [Pseudomonadota bacterium]
MTNFKYKFLILLLLGFSQGFPAQSFADMEPNLPWHRSNITLFKEEWGYKIPHRAVCSSNELKIYSCFELVVHEDCLKLFALLSLPDDIPYIFEEDKVPDSKIDGDLDEGLNLMIKYESTIGTLVVRLNLKETLLWWFTNFGDLQQEEIPENLTYYKLMTGEELTYYIYTKGGPTLRSTYSLEGLAPFLKESVQIAEEKFPEIKACYNK